MPAVTVAFWMLSLMLALTPPLDPARRDRTRRRVPDAAGRQGRGDQRAQPEGVLALLALLPQFTDPQSAWPMSAQIMLLGLVHVATCAVIYGAVGTGARMVLGTRPAAARAVTRFAGAAMTVIGVILLVERLIG